MTETVLSRREPWLDAAVDDLSDDLDGLLGRDALVAVMMSATVESVVALLACVRSAHSAVLLPRSLASHELHDILRDTGAAALLTPPFDDVSTLRDAQASSWVSAGIRVLVLKASPGQTPNWSGHQAQGEALVCQLTSGSMGASRLAVRRWSALQSEIVAVSERIDLSAEDRVLCASSTAHSYGLVGGLLAPLQAGASIAVVGGPEDAWRLAVGFRPTVIFGLAATYRALLQQSGAPIKAAVSATRLALSAGAPLPDGLFDAVLHRFDLPVRQDYGTTETGTISIDTAPTAIPETVGIPLRHMEVRLRPPADIPLGVDEQGEILVRSPTVAAGYLWSGNVVSCTDSDGWYHTGDAGRLDAEGRLYVGRRLRAAIRVDGHPVRPEVVEEVLRSLPGVKEVVALGARGPDGAQAIKAMVVAPGLDLDTVQAWIAKRLSHLIRDVIVELVDELPRSPAGKILQKYML